MTYMLVKDCNKATIKKEKGGRYKLIVGLYSQLLPEPCTKNTPENPHFKDRYDQVYYGLSTEEALWLVSRHNITAAMHH